MKLKTLKLNSMYAAANKLGYSLPFMNEICKRAFWSGRPFHVLKDENNKYFIEANSLQRYIDSCPDFNPYMIPGVYEPDNYDEDAPMDESVFILTEDMLPQVCGVAMKAIAYMIFVVTIGRLFELSVYTIFAPLPIATFASDTTHDVAKSFIKNYIATVIQIAVIVVMFIVYLAVSQYFANHTSGLSSLKLIQFIALISLGLGVMKSGNWAKKICGAA